MGFGQSGFGQAPYGDPILSEVTATPPGLRRSHRVQELLNYFDLNDLRIRKHPYSIDAQLLNLAATGYDDINIRHSRELKQNLMSVPTEIDNNGVYYQLTIPDGVQFDTVVGHIGTTDYVLTQYDDVLPVPKLLRFSPSQQSVPFTNPIMFTIVGTGDTVRQEYRPIVLTDLGSLVIPNTLTFWTDNTSLSVLSVDLLIEGETHPRPAWYKQRKKTTEVVTISGVGAATTKKRWSVIDKITVRGLPAGAKITCYSMPFGLPAVKDDARPYIHQDDRDRLYERYWQISNSEGLLKEMYRASGLSGLEYAQSYSTVEDLIDVAVQPDTFGLVIVSKSHLYYIDRREPWPDNLASTALTKEPLYGISVEYDVTRPGKTRFVTVTPVPFAGADTLFKYRYLVTTPTQNLIILPDGSTCPNAPSFGWRTGAPQVVTFPCLEIGTHTFSIECVSSDGVFTDKFPYPNLSMDLLASFNLDTNSISGVAYDSYGQLWIWTGTIAVPVNLTPASYVYDEANKHIYTTIQLDSVDVV
jgi:hypothetical protein